MPDSWFQQVDNKSSGNWFDSVDSSSNLPMKSQADKNMADAGELATPKSLSQRYIAPFVQPVLTGVGGGVGAAAGTPLGPEGTLMGGFTGGALGNVVAQYLQNQAPDYLGKSGTNPNSPAEQMVHGFQQSAYQESGGMAIGAGINAARNLPEFIRAGSPLLNRSKAIAQAGEDLNPSESTEQLAKTAANNTRTNFTNASDTYDKSAAALNSKANSAPSPYYREIKPEPDETTQEGEEGLEPKEPTYERIKAPIPITQTQIYAKKVYNQLDKSLSEAPIGDRDVRSVMKNLKTLVEEEPATDKIGTSQGLPVTEFYKVDRLKNSITNYLTKHPSGTTVAPDPVVDSLTDLNLKLTEDIDKGLQSWNNGAWENYANRQNLWINKSNIANPPMAQRLLTQGVDPQTTYETIAKDALQNVSLARQFITTTNDRPTLMKMAQRQLIEKSSDPNTGILDPQKLLNELNNPVYNAAIPSQALSNTKELFKNLASNQNNAFANQVRGVTIGHGGIGFGLSPFVLHAATGLPYKVSIGLLGGAKLTGMGIDRLMANPTTARAVIQMAKTPIGSPMVKTLSRVIFSGLKGENNLQVEDDKGNTFDARIDNQGNLAIQ